MNRLAGIIAIFELRGAAAACSRPGNGTRKDRTEHRATADQPIVQVGAGTSSGTAAWTDTACGLLTTGEFELAWATAVRLADAETTPPGAYAGTAGACLSRLS